MKTDIVDREDKHRAFTPYAFAQCYISSYNCPMSDVESCIELIEKSQSPEEAFEKYCAIVKRYGYDRVVYSLMTDHPSINLPRLHGLASSYPQHWIDHYNHSNYMDHDPVAQELLKTLRPFFWNDLMHKQTISKQSKLVMNEAAESGIHHGLSFSVPGKFGEITGFGLARTDRDHSSKKDYEALAVLHLISIYFHNTFRQMHQTSNHIQLTQRETEILQWAAEGKTDDLIADILKVSINTIRFHWKNIFKKLDAYGRVFAITKALRMELIQPVCIRPTYQSR